MSTIPDGQASASPDRPTNLLLRELPFLAVLVLTFGGVAYTSVSSQPLVLYWEMLAIVMGTFCIVSGWSQAEGSDARLRLVWTQTLHWAAFLGAMSIVLLPGVQRVLTASATGLTLLMLLALGTFTAGIHLSLRICGLALVMALAVPAIAWLKQSALFLLLAAAAILAVLGAIWWLRRDDRPVAAR